MGKLEAVTVDTPESVIVNIGDAAILRMPDATTFDTSYNTSTCKLVDYMVDTGATTVVNVHDVNLGN